MTDYISRQAAIDVLFDFAGCIVDTPNGDYQKAYRAYRNRLETLPSAQPEIVRCKDCKWVEHYGTDGNASYWCKNWDGGTDADGFCYEVERRTE